MPIPTPNSGESHTDFISRCHEALTQDHPDEDERHAICESAWNDKGKQPIQRTANMQYFNAKLDIKAIDDKGKFEGYASVFDVVDSYQERVAKGAFVKSLSEHKQAGTMPALLWQHNPTEPIGVWESMKEDEKGLYGKGSLVLESAKAKEAHALAKAKAVRGLSIGFVPKKHEYDEDEEITTLTEIDLWETSIVTFPANAEAQIEAVRGHLRAGERLTLQEFEAIMRDAGFTRKEAKAIAADGYLGLLPRDVLKAIDESKRAQHVQDLISRLRS